VKEKASGVVSGVNIPLLLALYIDAISSVVQCPVENGGIIYQTNERSSIIPMAKVDGPCLVIGRYAGNRLLILTWPFTYKV